MYQESKGVPLWAFIPALLTVLAMALFMALSKSCGQSEVTKLKKDAIHRKYATYDENGQFMWVEPEEGTK